MPEIVRVPTRAELYRALKEESLVLAFEAILNAVNNTLPGAADLVQSNLDAHIADTGDAHQASAIGATPGGTRPSNTVQGQLSDLDAVKFNASGVSAFGATLIDDGDAATARGTLGLGTMATQGAGGVAITGGNVQLASGALGYAAGNGGTVAQATSKTTGVTLNKMSGDITLNAAALASQAIVSFTLTNSNIAASDGVIAWHNSAGTNGAYQVTAQVLAGGASLISVKNDTAGSLSEAIVIRFIVIKAATS